MLITNLYLTKDLLFSLTQGKQLTKTTSSNYTNKRIAWDKVNKSLQLFIIDNISNTYFGNQILESNVNILEQYILYKKLIDY